MRKLLILGGSLGIFDVIAKARAMGCHVIVADYTDYELSRAKQMADEHWDVSTADLDELERRCRQEGVDAIYSAVSEFNLDRVVVLCERLGLPCYFDQQTWSYARNKAKFKEACREEGVPVIPDVKIDEGVLEYLRTGVPVAQYDIPFPVVVKPVDSSGNIGLSFCYDMDDFARAWDLATKVSSNPHVMVEEYVQGEQLHYLYVLAEGEASLLYSLLSFEQPGYPTSLYSVVSTANTHVEDWVRDVSPRVTRVFRRCGCRDGVAFVQAIYRDGQFHVLEMGHRLSADMSFNKVMGMTGFDALKWMIELQLGVKHTKDQLPLSQTHAFRDCASMYALFAQQEGTVSSIEGEDFIRELSASRCDGTDTDPINEITWETLVRPGDTVRQHQLLGRMVLHTDNAEELCDILRLVNQRLRIVDTSGRNMYIRYTDFDRVLSAYEESLSRE